MIRVKCMILRIEIMYMLLQNQNCTNRKTSNISRTFVGNKIVDNSDVVGQALLQLHLHSQLNTWLQWIEWRQPQEDTRNIWVSGFGATYTRGFTVTGKLRNGLQVILIPDYRDIYWVCPNNSKIYLGLCYAGFMRIFQNCMICPVSAFQVRVFIIRIEFIL